MRVLCFYFFLVLCMGCLLLFFYLLDSLRIEHYVRWSSPVSNFSDRAVYDTRDICYLFSDGSLKLTKKLSNQIRVNGKKDVTLAELNGQSVVVKTAPLFVVRVEDVFQNKKITVGSRWIKEETIDTLLWPELETVNGFSRQSFESMKRKSDTTNDHLFDKNEMGTLINDVVGMMNRKPSQEIWYHLRLPHASFLPKYFGKCNRSHVVEYLQNGDLQQFVRETLTDKKANRTMFNIWRNIIVRVIRLVHQLDDTELGSLYFCDAQAQNFGLTINWEVKLLDVDSLFAKKHVALATNSSCSDKHALCGLQHCHTNCNIKTWRCNPIQNDYNYWALCEMVFDEGKLIKERTEMKEHLTQEKFDYLQKLVNKCVISKHDATNIVHQIQILLENVT
ncbi:uncharacterized protein LOC134197092 [Corticium candelabrum]|uniref:uncharacterized protein LOC134197092 n=1 Tax=Corticium candelabrum TaxID=121492 RepID=UPI002E260C79|nr:uncharacterized protein LOC134197092 [Corticium candelabrum]